MTWIKIDDHFDEDPQFAAAGPLGVVMWATGLAYCNRNLTDGFIPWAVANSLVNWGYLGHLGGVLDPTGRPEPSEPILTVVLRDQAGRVEDVTNRVVIALLLETGLWVAAPGGYRVVDYETNQPSRVEVEERRAAARSAKQAAGRAGGRASSRARAAREASNQAADQQD